MIWAAIGLSTRSPTGGTGPQWREALGCWDAADNTARKGGWQVKLTKSTCIVFAMIITGLFLACHGSPSAQTVKGPEILKFEVDANTGWVSSAWTIPGDPYSGMAFPCAIPWSVEVEARSGDRVALDVYKFTDPGVDITVSAKMIWENRIVARGSATVPSLTSPPNEPMLHLETVLP